MTFREAFIQALEELGWSREKIELNTKMSDMAVTGAGPLTECPVQAGYERELIEFLKQVCREMDSNPRAVQDYVLAKLSKRATLN